MMLDACAEFSPLIGKAAPLSGFVSTTVGVWERSDIGSLMVSCSVDTTIVASRLAQVLGQPVPQLAGEFLELEARRAIWLTPRSWIMHCGLGDELQLAGQINCEFPDKLVHASLFSDYLCWLEIAGARAAELLAEGGFISLEKHGLPIGHAKRTLVAGVAAITMHWRVGRWLVGVERSRAAYFAAWLQAAAVRASKLELTG